MSEIYIPHINQSVSICWLYACVWFCCCWVGFFFSRYYISVDLLISYMKGQGHKDVYKSAAQLTIFSHKIWVYVIDSSTSDKSKDQDFRHIGTVGHTDKWEAESHNNVTQSDITDWNHSDVSEHLLYFLRVSVSVCNVFHLKHHDRDFWGVSLKIASSFEK